MEMFNSQKVWRLTHDLNPTTKSESVSGYKVGGDLDGSEENSGNEHANLGGEDGLLAQGSHSELPLAQLRLDYNELARKQV